MRGDAEVDQMLTITDAINNLRFQFLGAVRVPCHDVVDVDDDGVVAINDPIRLLTFLFLGGPPPRAPYPEPGLDRTPDRLPCEPGT